MSDEDNFTRHPPRSLTAVAGRFAAIGGVVFASALAFAYAGGWHSPERLTASPDVGLATHKIWLATLPR